MERVEPYRDVREMTPEVLLDLTQSHKFQTLKGSLKDGSNRTHDDILVTEQEIENMGETLKMVVFFVSPAIMRSAMELARDKGVLLQSPRWLKG
jgi:hypothetical protein